jgi:hypothetical protein
VVTAVLEAIVLGGTRVVGVVVALVLFAIGCFAFLTAYALAIGRSRTDEIGVANLYFLSGGTAPKAVSLRMNAALAVQIVVAVATASARPFTTLAFGILVPMYGLGLNGVWGARYGRFGRRLPDPPPRRKGRAAADADEGGEAADADDTAEGTEIAQAEDAVADKGDEPAEAVPETAADEPTKTAPRRRRG